METKKEFIWRVHCVVTSNQNSSQIDDSYLENILYYFEIGPVVKEKKIWMDIKHIRKEGEWSIDHLEVEHFMLRWAKNKSHTWLGGHVFQQIGIISTIMKVFLYKIFKMFILNTYMI